MVCPAMAQSILLSVIWKCPCVMKLGVAVTRVPSPTCTPVGTVEFGSTGVPGSRHT